MTNIEYIRNALGRADGDDLERAEMAFQGKPAKEMTEEWGQSGETCQKILDGYRTSRERHMQAVAFFERLVEIGGMSDPYPEPSWEERCGKTEAETRRLRALVGELGAETCPDCWPVVCDCVRCGGRGFTQREPTDER